ncbi:MAG: hypothetical protein C0596_06415 [Marinilabiliales bacterium]|nr:MAG: hypothetical protein C0596_06415 [Marinilabiliales bacterium]
MKSQFFNINFEITHSCNLKCKYCYNSTILGNSDSSRSINTIKKLYSKAKIKQLTISGGEPLLSDLLIECILHAKINGSKVAVITNATINNDNKYKELINFGVDFQITLNSINQKVYDFLSGKEGYLKNVLKNIKLILANNGRIIPTVILTKYNLSTIQDTFLFLKENNLNTIIVNRYNLSNNPHYKELTLNHNELRKGYNIIDNLAAKYGLIITSNVCTPHCIINPSDYSNIHFGLCPDDSKMKPLTVDYKGNFRLCNHSMINLGNIYNDSFEDMLYSDYSLSWISSIPDYCNDCEKYDKCKGGCKAAAEQIEGTKDKVDPIVKLNETQPLTCNIKNWG